MKVLEANGIRKCFGGVVALSNGNLACHEGRITGLLGANGSGKSTISKIITGVYSADAGEVLYKGRKVRYRDPHAARRDGIAMVYQNLSLVPDLAVWQNIVLGDESRRGLFLDNTAARARARRIVDVLLPGLDIRRTIGSLSPGEMQIVEIAKAISTEPKLLILDEPTAALEKTQVQSLFRCMRDLADRGVAINFTSHRIWEVMEICDDVIIFRNGENVGYIDFAKDGKDPERIVSVITGESRNHGIGPERRAAGEPVLRVRGLNHDGFLRGVSFDLGRGEILGIGGLAGQGQRELLLALAGGLRGVSGEAELNGKRIRLAKPAHAIRNGILLVPGDREKEGLFLRHSVFTNIVFPRLGLRHQPVFTPKARYMRECEEVIGTLSIRTAGLAVPVQTLSGGNQQKVVVGKWLPFNAAVLLLADPAKGVDIGAKRDMYAHIVRLARENGTSVVLYASDTEELIEYCDRLIIMYEGQAVATLEGEAINEDTIVATSMRVRGA